MTNQIFGEVAWDANDFGDKKQTNSKDLFLRLDEGSNELRIITQPFQYLIHKVKKDPTNPKDYGQKVSCSAIHGSCVLCDQGDKAKTRWLLGVISRKTNAYRILDISFAVFSQIKKYAKNVQRFGDPMKYDINIEVDKNGGATGYYLVQPLNKEPLSAADQAIKDAVDFDDLKRRSTPLTPENVQKRIDRIMGVPEGTHATLPVKTAASTAVVSNDDDELEKSFPSYEEATN